MEMETQFSYLFAERVSCVHELFLETPLTLTTF